MHSTIVFQKDTPEINQINTVMEDFRKSKAWMNSRLLICDIYDITKDLPDDDSRFKNQIRKLAVLISGNIVKSLQEKNPDLRGQFANNAESSMNKLNTLIQAAHKKGYLQKSKNPNLFAEIRRSLRGIQHQSDSR